MDDNNRDPVDPNPYIDSLALALRLAERSTVANLGQPLQKHLSFVHDLRRPPMTEMEKAIRFCDDHYDVVAQHFLNPSQRVYLGTRKHRRCRFCERCEPAVEFRNDAHAIPGSLGNKSLYSYHECDSCNQLFGNGIENDFGNWSLPTRTMARVKGKRRFPTIKRDGEGAWRLEAISSTEISLTGTEESPDITVDEATCEVTLALRRGKHTPVAVLKALVKMGLTILDDEEMPNFRQALAWIRETDHTNGTLPVHPVVHTFVPGPLPNNLIALVAFRRKHDDMKVPYASFMLSYANEMIQVFLPTPERNEHFAGDSIRLYRLPNLADVHESPHGPPRVNILDLSGTAVVEGAVTLMTTKFESVTSRSMQL